MCRLYLAWKHRLQVHQQDPLVSMHYLTQGQIDSMLQTPFFTKPVTENVVQYVLYRGRFDVLVHTYRYNLTPNFDVSVISRHLVPALLKHHPMGTRLLGNVTFDLLLRKPNTDSFYIWRANSNASSITTQQETPLMLNYQTMWTFANDAVQIHRDELDAFFVESNVIIVRPLAIVLSFMPM